uniref:Ninjurin a n=1 Tax=Anopheles culicifacies TaxID=139723 RepID=A0A182LSX3_9DIPT
MRYDSIANHVTIEQKAKQNKAVLISRANYGTVNPVDVTRSGHHGEHHNQPFPVYRPGFNPDGTHAIQITDDGHIIQNVNAYQQKKMITQGMMDLALLSANANQLRYVLESCQDHPFFEVIIVLISTSITIQVLVGMGLIWKSQYNTINENNYQEAKRISNLITIGIFLITLVNVMISAFNIAEIKSPSHPKQQ